MLDGAGRLRLLDYQDAFRAPRALDLVALLHDSYVEVPAARRARLLERYTRRSGSAPSPASLALLTVQRKCKDLGRYLYLSQVKGDVRFRPFVGAARGAVLGALPDLPEDLGDLAERLGSLLGEGPA
jgi:aminoglycoside/choline kinase family phosphotransferase